MSDFESELPFTMYLVTKKELEELKKIRSADYSKCNCSFRIRMLGDGCQFCNPELAKELEEEAKQPLVR